MQDVLFLFHIARTVLLIAMLVHPIDVNRHLHIPLLVAHQFLHTIATRIEVVGLYAGAITRIDPEVAQLVRRIPLVQAVGIAGHLVAVDVVAEHRIKRLRRAVVIQLAQPVLAIAVAVVPRVVVARGVVREQKDVTELVVLEALVVGMHRLRVVAARGGLVTAVAVALCIALAAGGLQQALERVVGE